MACYYERTPHTVIQHVHAQLPMPVRIVLRAPLCDAAATLSHQASRCDRSIAINMTRMHVNDQPPALGWRPDEAVRMHGDASSRHGAILLSASRSPTMNAAHDVRSGSGRTSSRNTAQSACSARSTMCSCSWTPIRALCEVSSVPRHNSMRWRHSVTAGAQQRT